MESISIVAKRNLENLLKDDLEVVQVVRDYGAHAGFPLFLSNSSLCSVRVLRLMQRSVWLHLSRTPSCLSRRQPGI